MTIADDRVLEFLHEEGPRTPTRITDDERVRFSRQYVNARCQKLTRYGLLETLGNGVYRITESGEAYLNGELDAASLETE